MVKMQKDDGTKRFSGSKHPATPLAVSISDVRSAGGKIVPGVSGIDALATYLAARERLELIELPEACKMIHISPSQMYNYVKRGTVPHLRLGRKILFIRLQLEGWLLGKCRGVVWNEKTSTYEPFRMGEAVV